VSAGSFSVSRAERALGGIPKAIADCEADMRMMEVEKTLLRARSAARKEGLQPEPPAPDELLMHTDRTLRGSARRRRELQELVDTRLSYGVLGATQVL